MQANTLSWSIYELARNPEWQAQVREEVQDAMNRNGLQTQQDLDGLKLLNAHLKVYPFTHYILVLDC
jgi:cytochrome P450